MSLHRINPSIVSLCTQENGGLTFALVEQLHGIGSDGKNVSDVFIAAEHLSDQLDPLVHAARLTPLMWSVNDLLSSSLMVCWALVPAVPLTEIFPLFVSSLRLALIPSLGDIYLTMVASWPFARASAVEPNLQARPCQTNRC